MRAGPHAGAHGIGNFRKENDYRDQRQHAQYGDSDHGQRRENSAKHWALDTVQASARLSRARIALSLHLIEEALRMAEEMGDAGVPSGEPTVSVGS